MDRKMYLQIGFVVSAALLLIVSSAQATPIALSNPSFEAVAACDYPTAIAAPHTLADNEQIYSSAVPGWWYSPYYGGTMNPTATYLTNASGASTPLGADGQNVAWSYGAAFHQGTYFTQDVTGAPIVAGNTYELTIAVGAGLDKPAQNEFFVGIYEAGFASGPFALHTGTSAELTAGQLTDFTVSFTAPGALAGKTMMVYFQGRNDGNETEAAVTYFDNVRLSDVTTPEPSTMALLVTGLIGLLAYAWRKQR